MSIIASQIHDVICYSIQSTQETSTIKEISTFVLSKDKQSFVHKQITLSIIQIIESFREDSSDELKLHDIKICLDVTNIKRPNIVELFASQVFNKYKLKTKDEAKLKSENLLSRLYENCKIAEKCDIPFNDIRYVLQLSIAELFNNSYKGSEHPFETKLKSKELISLREKVQFDLFRKEQIWFFAAKSILDIIFSDKHKTLNLMIVSFMCKNGILTVGAGQIILINYLQQETDKEVNLKIENRFISSACADSDFLGVCCLIERKASFVQTNLAEFINLMLNNITNKESMKDSIPNIIILTRKILFYSCFLMNREFELNIDLKIIVGRFCNTKPEIYILLRHLFTFFLKSNSIVIDNDTVEILIRCFFTGIIYTNAALNGIIDKDEFIHMSRNQILTTICKNIEKNKISKTYECLQLYKLVINCIYKTEPVFNQKNIENANIKEAINVLVFSIIGSDFMIKDIFTILNDFYYYLSSLSDPPEHLTEMTIDNSKLKLMLMIAINEKAESFILKNRSNIEIEWLQQQIPIEKFTKTETAVKVFLVPTVFSILAKALNTIKNDRYDILDFNDTELNVKECLQNAFQLNNCELFTKDNILNQIQQLLISNKVFSQIMFFIKNGGEYFINNLSDKINKELKNKQLTHESKMFLRHSLYCSRSKEDVIDLVDKFILYIFNTRASIKHNNFTYQTYFLQAQAFVILQPELDDLVNLEFQQEFNILLQQFLSSHKYLFVKIKNNFTKINNLCSCKILNITSKENMLSYVKDGVENYFPILVGAVLIRTWAKEFGLNKLIELDYSNVENIFIEIFSSNTNKDPIIEVISSLEYSVIDRELFELCLRLCNIQKDPTISSDKIEQSLLFIILILKQENKLESYILDVIQGLIDSTTQINKSKNKTLLEKPLKEIKELKKAEKELNKLDVFLSKELSKCYKDAAIYNKTMKNTNDSFISTTFNNSQNIPQNIPQSINETTEELTPLQLEQPKKEDKLLEILSQTVDEIIYTGQSEAFDDTEETFGILSDREKQMLLFFSSRLKIKVSEPLYEKGKIEGSETVFNNLKETWESYKIEDPLALEGASASQPPFLCNITAPKSFRKWLSKRNPKIQEEINKRLDQIISNKNFGKIRSIHNKLAGAFELKFNDSDGTRIYYIMKENRMYILCGGDKSDQDRVITNKLNLLVSNVKSEFNF